MTVLAPNGSFIPNNPDAIYQITNSISLFSNPGINNNPTAAPVPVITQYNTTQANIVSRTGKALRASSILSKPDRKSSLVTQGSGVTSIAKGRFFIVKPNGGSSPYCCRQRLSSENTTVNTTKKKIFTVLACDYQTSHPTLTQQQSQPKRVRISCNLVEGGKIIGMPTLRPEQVSEIYLAKCEDMKLEKFANQEVRFQDYCRRASVDGKIVLREVFL